MLRVDLHLHSTSSHDGWVTPVELVERASEAGLDKIAITDHGEIDGALRAHSEYPDHVVVGEEIHCRRNTHLIGLFLREWIPHGLAVRETADRIRSQGGVVYAPHPFAYVTHARRRASEVIRVADIVEVFNSRAFLPSWNRRAAAAAQDRRLPAAASSDAHFPFELGRAYTELPDFGDAKEFLSSARQARPVGIVLGSPLVHVASRIVADCRRVRAAAVGNARRGGSCRIL